MPEYISRCRTSSGLADAGSVAATLHNERPSKQARFPELITLGGLIVHCLPDS